MPREDELVIKRLKDRAKGVKDKYKIGLIVEGGGMRGAFSGGAMVGLQKLGLTNCFDFIYASSSGSCAGAYFLSGQAKAGSSIYYKELNGYKFIKPWKINRAADIDYLCDVIFRHKRKLDLDKIKKSKTILKIFVADVDNGNCVYYTNKDKIDLIQVIKASCALPVFYNKPVTIGPNQHMDGRIGKSLPVEDALTDGCTDILVITVVPETYRQKTENVFVNLFKRMTMKNLPKRYRKVYRNRRKINYNESLDVIFGRKKIHRKVNLYTISPDRVISKFETRQRKLQETVERGTRVVEKVFS